MIQGDTQQGMNKAVGLFHREHLGEFGSWYNNDIIRYLISLYQNGKPGLYYVMYDAMGADLIKQFADQLQQLVMLRNKVGGKVPGHFICKEFGHPHHYIYGYIFEGAGGLNLLLVNPIGRTAHKGFYDGIKEIEQRKIFEKIYVSKTVIQRDPGNCFVSCGPICIELLKSFGGLSTEEVLSRLVVSEGPGVVPVEVVTEEVVMEQVGGEVGYKEVEIKFSGFLGALSLLGDTGDYVDLMTKLRGEHLESLSLIGVEGDVSKQNEICDDLLNTPEQVLVRGMSIDGWQGGQADYGKLYNSLSKRLGAPINGEEGGKAGIPLEGIGLETSTEVACVKTDAKSVLDGLAKEFSNLMDADDRVKGNVLKSIEKLLLVSGEVSNEDINGLIADVLQRTTIWNIVAVSDGLRKVTAYRQHLVLDVFKLVDKSSADIAPYIVGAVLKTVHQFHDYWASSMKQILTKEIIEHIVGYINPNIVNVVVYNVKYKTYYRKIYPILYLYRMEFADLEVLLKRLQVHHLYLLDDQVAEVMRRFNPAYGDSIRAAKEDISDVVSGTGAYEYGWSELVDQMSAFLTLLRSQWPIDVVDDVKVVADRLLSSPVLHRTLWAHIDDKDLIHAVGKCCEYAHPESITELLRSFILSGILQSTYQNMVKLRMKCIERLMKHMTARSDLIEKDLADIILRVFLDIMKCPKSTAPMYIIRGFISVAREIGDTIAGEMLDFLITSRSMDGNDSVSVVRTCSLLIIKSGISGDSHKIEFILELLLNIKQSRQCVSDCISDSISDIVLHTKADISTKVSNNVLKYLVESLKPESSPLLPQAISLLLSRMDHEVIKSTLVVYIDKLKQNERFGDVISIILDMVPQVSDSTLRYLASLLQQRGQNHIERYYDIIRSYVKLERVIPSAMADIMFKKVILGRYSNNDVRSKLFEYLINLFCEKHGVLKDETITNIATTITEVSRYLRHTALKKKLGLLLSDEGSDQHVRLIAAAATVIGGGNVNVDIADKVLQRLVTAICDRSIDIGNVVKDIKNFISNITRVSSTTMTQNVLQVTIQYMCQEPLQLQSSSSLRYVGDDVEIIWEAPVDGKEPLLYAKNLVYVVCGMIKGSNNLDMNTVDVDALLTYLLQFLNQVGSNSSHKSATIAAVEIINEVMKTSGPQMVSKVLLGVCELVRTNKDIVQVMQVLEIPLSIDEKQAEFMFDALVNRILAAKSQGLREAIGKQITDVVMAGGIHGRALVILDRVLAVSVGGIDMVALVNLNRVLKLPTCDANEEILLKICNEVIKGLQVPSVIDKKVAKQIFDALMNRMLEAKSQELREVMVDKIRDVVISGGIGMEACQKLDGVLKQPMEDMHREILLGVYDEVEKIFVEQSVKCMNNVVVGYVYGSYKYMCTPVSLVYKPVQAIENVEVSSVSGIYNEAEQVPLGVHQTLEWHAAAPMVEGDFMRSGPPSVPEAVGLISDGSVKGLIEGSSAGAGSSRDSEWYGAVKHNVFVCSTVASRLPRAWNDVKYITKELTGGWDGRSYVDIDAWLGRFDEEVSDRTGIEDISGEIGRVLKPTLVLGGGLLSYMTTKSYHELAWAMSQPEYGLKEKGLYALEKGLVYGMLSSSALYYGHAAYVGVKVAAMVGVGYTSSAVVVPGLMCGLLLGHILGRVGVDTGMVSSDNVLVGYVEKMSGVGMDVMGFVYNPLSVLKVMHGIGILRYTVVPVKYGLSSMYENVKGWYDNVLGAGVEWRGLEDEGVLGKIGGRLKEIVLCKSGHEVCEDMEGIVNGVLSLSKEEMGEGVTLEEVSIMYCDSGVASFEKEGICEQDHLGDWSPVPELVS